jgi:hypothetical protein
VPTLSLEAHSRRLCRCGHPYVAHRHYRIGSECSLCLGCPRYRSAAGLFEQIMEWLTGRLGRR